MNEKKFSIVLILMSVASFILSLFSMSIEGIAFGLATIIASVVKKEKYRVKLPIGISLFAVLVGVYILIWFCMVSKEMGESACDYWFIELLYGKYIEW